MQSRLFLNNDLLRLESPFGSCKLPQLLLANKKKAFIVEICVIVIWKYKFSFQLNKHCTRHSHCDRGFQCYKKRCIRTRKCRTAPDCPENHICNSISGACLPSRQRQNTRSNRLMHLMPSRPQHQNARSNRLMHLMPSRQNHQNTRYSSGLRLMPLRGHRRHGRYLRRGHQLRPMWIWN